MNYEIILEDFGGEVLSCEISALKNMNLDGLMETILLQSEMMQLCANPNRKAVGIILESKISSGKGIVASAIVQNGTLTTGDIFVAGGSYGKVRVIHGDTGKKLTSAEPSTPIEIVGFNSAPEPGDVISVVDSEQKAREIAEYRQRIQKERANKTSSMTVEQLIAGKNAQKFELNIVIKSDVSGSVEALSAAINSIEHEEIDIKITDSGVGMINESDIDFAKNTRSIVLGFNIGITSIAKDNAKLNMVKVYNNSVIYHIIEEVKREMSALLPPTIEENYIGTADVRKIFMISRFGTIAGCYVTDGIMRRNDSKIKVMRGGDCVFEGKIRSMKHEKDEIKESKQSHECGILAEGFNDFLEGDAIECYEIIQKSRFVV
jgi:translation initiation factor IF-2